MAIVLAQLLSTYMRDTSIAQSKRQEVFLYFGTFTRAVVTMFEISMGNWVVSCRILSENVSLWYGAFYVVYRCCFMFAILKVITAVFIAETTRCANSDDELAVTRKQRQREHYCARLKQVFHELDVNNDGSLSKEELEPLISDDVLSIWLDTLDIDTYDLSMLFQIHSGDDGKFSIKEFIEGLTHVRGPAKSIDLMKLMVSTWKVTQKVEAIQSLLEVDNLSSLKDMDHVLVQMVRTTNSKLDMLIRQLGQGMTSMLMGPTEITKLVCGQDANNAPLREADMTQLEQLRQEMTNPSQLAAELTNPVLDVLCSLREKGHEPENCAQWSI